MPLHKERYDLVIKKEDLQNPVYQTIINIINSPEFKAELHIKIVKKTKKR
ncbi:hypothetical protein ACTPEF_25200 [Clostridioides difficile]